MVEVAPLSDTRDATVQRSPAALLRHPGLLLSLSGRARVEV